MDNIKGRKIWLVGAGGGIGSAIARELARRGASLCLSDPNLGMLQNLEQELQTGGRQTTLIAVDVRDRAAVQAASDELVRRWGSYDGLVSNAGVSTMRPALELTDEDWDFNFDVNARGMFLTNQIAARQFLAAGCQRASIVNTASLAAKVGAPLLAHYSASKFAVAGWTQALARELAPQGIRVNAVCPGFVRTAMQEREVGWEAKLRNMSEQEVVQSYIAQTPLGRLETPEDVSGVVAFLLSDAARFMTGQSINVTGGVFMQ